jgi:MFS family permease
MQDSGGVFAASHRALTVGILLAVTAIACEGMAVSTVMPSIAVALGGLADYGWAFSAFMLASLIGAIAAGRSSDRLDVLSPARLGFASFAVGLVLGGFAPAWPVLLAARAVMGFGAGCLIGVAYVAVARGYPESLRPRLMALLSSAWVIPALVGPAVAGQVAEHASWRLVFIGIVPPTVLAAWMLLPRLSRLSVPGGRSAGTSEAADGDGRLRTALRLSLGVALALAAVSVNALLLSLALVAVGIALALPALERLLPDGTTRARNGLPAAVCLRGLLAFGFFGAEALIPLGLATSRDLPPSLVGLALTAGALAWVAGSWGQDRAEAAAAGSMSQRALRAAGGLVFVLAGIGCAAAVIGNPGLPVELAVVAWALGGLGMGVAYPAATLTALGSAASGAEGSAAASLQIAETIATAVGTGAAGALFALAASLGRPMSEGLAWGFVLAAAAIVLAIVPAIRLAPDTRLSQKPPLVVSS